jgi:hypothetical protein
MVWTDPRLLRSVADFVASYTPHALLERGCRDRQSLRYGAMKIRNSRFYMNCTP